MNEKTLQIVILAGFSAVGKSTISSNFSEKYGWSLIKHQELVHGIARSKGYERARYWLKDVGIDTFMSESVTEMIKRIREVEEASGVLIDASYGPSMVDGIKKAFPKARVATAAILAEPETKEVRMAGRMGAEREVARTEKEFRDGFLKEAGVERVISEADITIYNKSEIGIAIEELSNKLQALGFIL